MITKKKNRVILLDYVDTWVKKVANVNITAEI